MTATYAVTKIKTFNGREGQGLNATITKNGKAICFVMDDASGGEVDYDYRNPLQNAASFHATTREMAEAAEHDLGEYCISVLSADELLEIDGYIANAKASYAPELNVEMRRRGDAVERWVNKTVDAHSNKKRMDRIAKKKTLFRCAGDKPDEYRTLKVPYGPDVQAWLDKKYPNKVVEIYGVKAAS
jgi:hypothetical protein